MVCSYTKHIQRGNEVQRDQASLHGIRCICSCNCSYSYHNKERFLLIHLQQGGASCFLHACGFHSHSKQAISVILCFSFPSPMHPTPTTHYHIYAGPKLMNHLRKSSESHQNQALFICQVNCVKINRVTNCKFLVSCHLPTW